ncbi:hypothetical protein F7725_027694 [Dissostichus mawsoni]|uniref:OCIA domain-containing protein n=1 Tax=Dissostichus mawsoni TaxID=36200 RepID=A0A7J5XDM2_DISMA|nr:hypothetical protein F7725_027694 [Dissostichus mawsoni]
MDANHVNSTTWSKLVAVCMATNPDISCIMSSETITVKTGEAAAAADIVAAPKKGEWKCPLSDHHVHREDVRKVWKECQEESFWYRALPLSMGSMAVTGGLIYNGGPGSGPWAKGGSFGPFNKSGHGHRSCHHVCEECKKKAQDAPAEQGAALGDDALDHLDHVTWCVAIRNLRKRADVQRPGHIPALLPDQSVPQD